MFFNLFIGQFLFSFLLLLADIPLSEPYSPCVYMDFALLAPNSTDFQQLRWQPLNYISQKDWAEQGVHLPLEEEEKKMCHREINISCFHFTGMQSLTRIINITINITHF